jgi:hypothetical protein
MRSSTGYAPAMFFFFSNTLGWKGSLLLSLIVTAVLLVVLGVINLG